MAFLFGVPPSEKLHLLFFFFFLDFLFFNSTPSWRDGRHFSLAVFVCLLLLFFFWFNERRDRGRSGSHGAAINDARILICKSFGRLKDAAYTERERERERERESVFFVLMAGRYRTRTSRRTA